MRESMEDGNCSYSSSGESLRGRLSSVGEIRIAVVVPAYRVQHKIIDVLAKIGPECCAVYVIDDACPEGSGELVRERCNDPQVRVVQHESNQGVGGATVTGFRHAIADDMDVVVKIDGDGQMDPSLMPKFVSPIARGAADFTKGNRFFNLEDVRAMPAMRLIGNAGLSFLTKISCGYWSIFDPTNGYFAVSAKVLAMLPLDKLDRRYFFESDLLFRLNTVRACVVDIPMQAVYADETSNLVVRRVIFEFFRKNIRNAFKRLFYNYFLRDFSVATLQLLVGLVFLSFGVLFGAIAWIGSAASGHFASTGTVMLSVLPTVLGVQLLIAFIGYDIAATPTTAIHPLLQDLDKKARASGTAGVKSTLDRAAHAEGEVSL